MDACMYTTNFVFTVYMLPVPVVAKVSVGHA